jgi:uncharacterized membrane protein
LKTKDVAISGIMIALVFVLTFAIKVPVPFTRGYVHLGDSMIFISAILFGRRVGALAGGLGSALADLVGGYAYWAIPTLIIKSVMGALVGWISDSYRNKYSGKKELTIFLSSIGIWLAFSLTLSLFLKNLIENLATSPFTNNLMNELGYENIEELENFLLNARGLINIILLAIPIAIILISLFLRGKDSKIFRLGNLMGSMIAGLWMVIGYFFTGRIIVGNWVMPIFEVPWNVLQFTVGILVAYIVLFGLQKTKLFENSQK